MLSLYDSYFRPRSFGTKLQTPYLGKTCKFFITSSSLAHKHLHHSLSITFLVSPALFGPNTYLQKVWPINELLEVEPLSPLRVGLFALTL